jgi:hypothetical protein
VLADGEPHHVTPGASDDAARLWAEDQTKCGSPYSFTFLPLCPPATHPQQAAPAAQGDALDAARLEFAMSHGLPMERDGLFRYHGFAEQGWHTSKLAAIDAAMADKGGAPS